MAEYRPTAKLESRQETQLIKQITTLFVLFTLLAATAAKAQIPTIAEDAIVSQVFRTTIMVRDLDESLKLYRDILGFRPRWEDTLESPFWDKVLGWPGGQKQLKVMIMETTGGGPFGNVGLFQYLDENGGPPVYKAPRVQTGDVALIFLTKNIHEIHEKVKRAGYTIIAPPLTQDPEPGPGSGYEMMFFDRDGVIINLIQVAVPPQ